MRSLFSEKNILIFNFELIWKSITEYINESIQNDLRIKSLNEFKNEYQNKKMMLYLHLSWSYTILEIRNFHFIFYRNFYTIQTFYSKFFARNLFSKFSFYLIDSSFDRNRNIKSILQQLNRIVILQKSKNCWKYTYKSNLHLFEYFEIFLRQFRNIKSNLQQMNKIDNQTKAKVWKIDENTHSNRVRICLNISKFFYFETILQHQIDFTTIERNRQSCKNLKKCWKYTINSNIHLFKRFATFLHRNCFAITKKLINQKFKITYNAKTSNSKNLQQCMLI